jgi:hypothetical protein
MDDFYDDFDDDFSEDGDDFMDDSEGVFEPDDPFDEDSGIEEGPTEDICGDKIPMEDAVFIGGTMMGWAYEEGLEDAERRKLEKKMEDDQEKPK